MLKAFRRIPVSNVAYVLLLVAFVALGLFVTAMALGSNLAVVAAAAMVACLGSAVAGFRASARRLSAARLPGAPTNNVSMFSTPVDQGQVDRYREMYRAEGQVRTEDRTMAVLPGGESKNLIAPSADTRHRHAA